MYLKKKASDSDIMKAFGINAETLVAIKKDKYDPVEGISLDNQSKIYKEFKRLENRIDSLFNGIDHIAECIFITEEDKKTYKNSFKKTKAKKEKKVKKNLEYDGMCEQSDNFGDDEEE
jgi:hypothetical protein